MNRATLRVVLLVATLGGVVAGAGTTATIQTNDASDILLYGPVTFSPAAGPEIVVQDNVVLEHGGRVFESAKGMPAVDLPGQVTIGSTSDAARVTVTELSPSVTALRVSNATAAVRVAPAADRHPTVVVGRNVTELRIYNLTSPTRDLNYNATTQTTLRVYDLPPKTNVTVTEADTGAFVAANTTTDSGVLWVTVPASNHTLTFSAASGVLWTQCSAYQVTVVGCVSTLTVGVGAGLVVVLGYLGYRRWGR